MTDSGLITAAAERVMNWRVQQRTVAGKPRLEIYRDGMADAEWSEDGRSSAFAQWNPLDSDADAFMLVDNLVARGFAFQLEFCQLAKQWEASFESSAADMEYDHDPDRRRAIVIAALKACGVKA